MDLNHEPNDQTNEESVTPSSLEACVYLISKLLQNITSTTIPIEELLSRDVETFALQEYNMFSSQLLQQEDQIIDIGRNWIDKFIQKDDASEGILLDDGENNMMKYF